MMKFYDLHTHTTYSDGATSVSVLKEAADHKGYGLGITDHLFCCGMNTLHDIEKYLNDLSQYEDILMGGEANAGEDYSMPDSIMSRFDYIIASIHKVPDFNGGYIHLGSYFGARAGEAVIWDKSIIDKDRSRESLEAIILMVKHTMETQRMDIYGHSTVLPFCEILKNSAFLRDWENEVISLCKKNNVALEISGLWKEPGLSMVVRAKEAGVKFTMGSDCHTVSGLCDLDYGIKLYKAAGLTEKDMWLPS